MGKCWILKDFQWVSLVIGLEGGNTIFALATGEGGVGSWNLLCEYLENIYKIKK